MVKSFCVSFILLVMPAGYIWVYKMPPYISTEQIQGFDITETI